MLKVILDEGQELLSFSKSIGVKDSNEAEIMTILEALKIS